MKANSTHLYNCPNCKFVIASGNLITLKAICPDCNKLVEIKIDRAIESSLKTYGRDCLKISEMHDNKKDAIQSGHSHYYTGLPCRYGPQE